MKTILIKKINFSGDFIYLYIDKMDKEHHKYLKQDKQ